MHKIVAVDVAMNAARDEMMIDDDKIPTDGRDSGIEQSAADHLSSGTPSRIMSGLHKSSDQGMIVCLQASMLLSNLSENKHT